MFHTPPVLDGQGYFSAFSTPLGVTADMIADQVGIFARNLHRAKTEVWPTDAERGGDRPGRVRGGVDRQSGGAGQARAGIPAAARGTATVYLGACPLAESPRGNAIDIPVVGNNFAAGRLSWARASARTHCRVIMLGAAPDPLAELWVHVFAYNGDFGTPTHRVSRGT